MKTTSAVSSIVALDLSPPAPPPEVEPAPPTVAQLLRENARLRHALAATPEMRSLAYRDLLTELWNRHYFESRLLEEMSRVRRHRGRSVSIIVVDVTGMADINEVHGHDVGDHCLKCVACLLRAAVREYDVIARLGGDEFGLILPETDFQGASKVAERIRSLSGDVNGRWGLPLSVSIGLTTYSEGDLSGSEVLERAEAARRLDQKYPASAA